MVPSELRIRANGEEPADRFEGVDLRDGGIAVREGIRRQAQEDGQQNGDGRGQRDDGESQSASTL